MMMCCGKEPHPQPLSFEERGAKSPPLPRERGI